MFSHGNKERECSYSKGTSAPWATTTDLVQVCELREGILVAERNVDDAVMSEGAEGGDDSALLATTLGTAGHEDANVLAVEGATSPLAAGAVPEGLPLAREVTETCGDADQDGVVGLELLGVAEDRHALRLSRGVQLSEDLLWEGLGDSVMRVEVSLCG